MSSWIDNEYAIRVLSYERNYKLIHGMPIRINCSCPICGDSQKDRLKARFWYYHHQNTTFVHCFNCDYSSRFDRFLQEKDEEVYREYMMEKFKENGNTVERSKPVEVSDKLTTTFNVIEKLNYSTRIDTLPENHPIVKYVSTRRIPKEKWHRLWFTDKWQELCNSVKPGTFENPKQEFRLVIPIFNKKGEIESFQGRALKASNIKYMTIKAHEHASKVYGQDTIDESKDFVFVMEGPIDSLFLENALAITGGSLNLDQVPYPEKRIWVLDNECRHPDTIKRMNKLIEAGERVCFWDQAPWQSKDVNDMVAKDGALPEQIQQYILENSESGLMAQIRMTQFSKI
ncbi:DNA primase subunit [Acinetobacter phage vB_AbaM_PhT2]|uniref:DNA primase subunit n=1 Tax=Acinetobacter phage vB_AbaM_PhT2 TaxID=2690230 RepID=A0A6B9SXM4_9CAUD|nr:DNA primase [Acinetobacter phage vB_AbaM_PhT2]QHJ75639.1 DNA primase subunit [Acinetobacter phage vB_AbaM_PhT2]QQM13791.1 DNA primase [Acinetobacter phage Maestro]QQM18547.1 DNA primase [Acinetobacter phage Morttis]SSU39394.1 DNA primase [Acinetobacter baumannii]